MGLAGPEAQVHAFADPQQHAPIAAGTELQTAIHEMQQRLRAHRLDEVDLCDQRIRLRLPDQFQAARADAKRDLAFAWKTLDRRVDGEHDGVVPDPESSSRGARAFLSAVAMLQRDE